MSARKGLTEPQRVQRGMEAQQVRDVLDPAFEHMEARIGRMIMETLPHEKEKREGLYQRGQAITTLKSYLRKLIDDGKVAGVTAENRNRSNGGTGG